MRYRRFGKTNLNLSVFSLGTMRCLADPQTTYTTIQTAIESGINHLETARGYGLSEELIGWCLQQGLPVGREQIYITTKLPPTTDASQLQSGIESSLTRLGIDYLDCLAIHGINTWEHLQAVTSPPIVSALQAAQASGKIRHLGFSTHGSLDLIVAAINTDLFEFVNLHYYYFWQRNSPAIALAACKDLGIFIISPADKGGKLYTPSGTLAQLCQPYTPLELNYRFLLGDRRITTLSVGPAKATQLAEPLQVADRDYPLTETELATFRRLQEHLEAELGGDRCTGCYQCLPCPEQINIPEILRLRNLTVAYNMKAYGQYRYRMLEQAGHWFPGKKGDRCTDCGDCLPRCPQGLDIPSLLEQTHQMLNGSPRRRLWD